MWHGHQAGQLGGGMDNWKGVVGVGVMGKRKAASGSEKEGLVIKAEELHGRVDWPRPSS